MLSIVQSVIWFVAGMLVVLIIGQVQAHEKVMFDGSFVEAMRELSKKCKEHGSDGCKIVIEDDPPLMACIHFVEVEK